MSTHHPTTPNLAPVTDGAVAVRDDDGTPLAAWRRLDTPTRPSATRASHCGTANGPHDCLEPADHTGDHVCAGCGDRWNSGPWDEDPDDLDPWQGPTCLDDLNDDEPIDEGNR